MPAKSKAQQRFMGMVHAYQKGELDDAPASVKKAAESMTKKAAKEFASTKTEKLPEKVKENASFKDFLIQEGILGQVGNFARGAAAMAGDAVDRGAAMKKAQVQKQALQAAMNALKVVGSVPGGETALYKALGALGTEGKLGAQLYAQVKNRQAKPAAAQPQQRQAPAQQAAATPAQQQRPNPFKAQQKAKMVPGQHGYEYKYEDFDFVVDGKDLLQEAVGAFLGGMAKAAAGKAKAAATDWLDKKAGAYGKVFNDLAQAGVDASRRADLAKQQKTSMSQIQTIARQLAQIAAALVSVGAGPGRKVAA